MFLLLCCVFRRVSLMGWNHNLLFSIHICTHVNKSGRDWSSTQGLPPTGIQLNLAGLGFILGKKTNQPQVFKLNHKHVLFIKYMCILCALQPNCHLGLKWFTCCTEVCIFKGILNKKKRQKIIQQKLQNQKGYQEQISTKVRLHCAMHYWTVINALECLTA